MWGHVQRTVATRERIFKKSIHTQDSESDSLLPIYDNEKKKKKFTFSKFGFYFLLLMLTLFFISIIIYLLIFLFAPSMLPNIIMEDLNIKHRIQISTISSIQQPLHIRTGVHDTNTIRTDVNVQIHPRAYNHVEHQKPDLTPKKSPVNKSPPHSMRAQLKSPPSTTAAGTVILENPEKMLFSELMALQFPQDCSKGNITNIYSTLC
jgi:hypothetical protein